MNEPTIAKVVGQRHTAFREWNTFGDRYCLMYTFVDRMELANAGALSREIYQRYS